MTSKKPIEESVSQVASSEQLPEYWPATPPPDPVRAVWIPWPIAVVLAPLLWLMPGRMGPHFAAVRWPGAIAAHLLWTVYGLACIVNAYESNDHCWVAYLQGQVPGQQQHPVWPAPTMSQIIRTPLAVTAWQLAEEIDDTADKFVACLGTLALVGSSLVVLAACLIPYADGGEKGRRLFGRCLKLTLWSTTPLVVLGLVLQAIELDLFEELVGADDLASSLAVSIYIVWAVSIWLRSGYRYAGPAEGPGWRRRQPMCERCGYNLTGLPTNRRCPECGSSVADSLPRKRKPSRYAAADTMLARVPAFFMTVVAVITAPGFFRRLAIHSHYRSARRFAIRVCVLSGLAFCIVRFLAQDLLLSESHHAKGYPDTAEHWLDAFLAEWVVVTVGLLLLVGLVGLLGMRLGSRQVRADTTTTFYAAAWLAPVMIAVALGWAAGKWTTRYCDWPPLVDLGPLGMVDGEVIAALLSYGLLPLIVGALGLIRLGRGIRQARMANA